MGSSFRLLDHPSDVGFEARGATWEELLDAAVQALAAIQTGGSLPAAADRRPHGVEDQDPEGALVSVLEACVALLDAEDWLAVGVRGDELLGVALTDAEREVGTHCKAITWHQLAVERTAEGGWRAVVYVDL
jgi:SHS2 domain-containing protein